MPIKPTLESILSPNEFVAEARSLRSDVVCTIKLWEYQNRIKIDNPMTNLGRIIGYESTTGGGFVIFTQAEAEFVIEHLRPLTGVHAWTYFRALLIKQNMTHVLVE